MQHVQQTIRNPYFTRLPGVALFRKKVQQPATEPGKVQHAPVHNHIRKSPVNPVNKAIPTKQTVVPTQFLSRKQGCIQSLKYIKVTSIPKCKAYFTFHPVCCTFPVRCCTFVADFKSKVQQENQLATSVRKTRNPSVVSSSAILPRQYTPIRINSVPSGTPGKISTTFPCIHP